MAKTIFMAEDDSFLLKIFGKVFTLEGFDLKVAKNGTEAKEAMTQMQEAPSVFLLDVMMPGMSGFELFEYIKSQEKLKNVPVIFFTNLYSDDDAKKAKDMGANMYLLKSDNYPQDVVAKIKSLIS